MFRIRVQLQYLWLVWSKYMFRIRVQLQYLWLVWSEYMFRIRVQLQYLWLVWSKYMFRIRVQLQYLWLIWSPGQGLNWTRLLLLLQPRNWTSPGGKLSIVILMEFCFWRKLVVHIPLLEVNFFLFWNKVYCGRSKQMIDLLDFANISQIFNH